MRQLSGCATAVTVGATLLAGGCTDPHIRIVQEFRAAVKSGDTELARTFLAEDARMWFENKSGEGRPWKLGGGFWKQWDEYFNATSRPLGAYQVLHEPDGAAVWLLNAEMNDFYRLTGRGEKRVLLTWYFDGQRKIRGLQIAGVGKAVDRLEEFREWARSNEPSELEYLMPGGEIDPSGDRPERFKAILERWRGVTGLPAVDGL